LRVTLAERLTSEANKILRYLRTRGQTLSFRNGKQILILLMPNDPVDKHRIRFFL
jgi:hypothetical protein